MAAAQARRSPDLGWGAHGRDPRVRAAGSVARARPGSDHGPTGSPRRRPPAHGVRSAVLASPATARRRRDRVVGGHRLRCAPTPVDGADPSPRGGRILRSSVRSEVGRSDAGRPRSDSRRRRVAIRPDGQLGGDGEQRVLHGRRAGRLRAGRVEPASNDPARSRAGRSRRGDVRARADRAGAPRHRRPQHERDGRPGGVARARCSGAIPDEAERALRAIEESGRLGLAELRRLLASEGELTPTLAPQPGLESPG